MFPRKHDIQTLNSIAIESTTNFKILETLGLHKIWRIKNLAEFQGPKTGRKPLVQSYIPAEEIYGINPFNFEAEL